MRFAAPGLFATPSTERMRTQLSTASAPALFTDEELQPPVQSSASSHQLKFKKHKVLPHPRKDGTHTGPRASNSQEPSKSQGPALATVTAATFVSALPDDTSPANSRPSSPRTKKQYPKSLGNDLDFPPTPPAHSRNSSSTYSVPPSTATYVQSPEHSVEDMLLKLQLMTTPTKQLSPPTPEVTPPHDTQYELRPKRPALRIPHRSRDHSKGRTDSTTGSYKTAREGPSSSSSDNDDVFWSLRPALIPGKMSKGPVRGTVDDSREHSIKRHRSQGIRLDLGVEPISAENAAPIAHFGCVTVDSQRGSSSDEAAKEWVGNLFRNAAVHTNENSIRVAETSGSRDASDKCASELPKIAMNTTRSISLPQKMLNSTVQAGTNDYQQVQIHSQYQDQHHQSRDLLSGSATPISAQMASTSHPSLDGKIAQGFDASRRSTVQADVEAIAIGTLPKRQRPLRHVKKMDALREMGLGPSFFSSVAPSQPDKTNQQWHPNDDMISDRLHDNLVRVAGVNNIMSRSARREIWKAGDIPVVIVPGRLSSIRPTNRELSLRSSSSRKSKPSQESRLVSPLQASKCRDVSACAESRGRRSRAYSESGTSTRHSSVLDGSAPGDQRTIDFPPTIPRRSSSLSAPTSRSVSRCGSMTAESDQTRAAILRSGLKIQVRSHQASEHGDPSSGQVAQPFREARLFVQAGASDFETPIPGGVNSQCPDTVLRRDSKADQKPVQEQTMPFRSNNVVKRDERMQQNSREDANGDDSNADHCNYSRPRSNLDCHADRDRARHLSPHNTPFSIASVETSTTHHSLAEVSEALAVSIYAHQNTSVLVVDHSTRHSDSSIDSQAECRTDPAGKRTANSLTSLLSIPGASSSVVTPSEPKITETLLDAREGVPVKLLHEHVFPSDNYSSPLENPRFPPELPAIQLIPATPSGLTPSTIRELQRGDQFGLVRTGRSRRRRSVSSVLRRALSRRRSAKTGFEVATSKSGGLLTRALSLTTEVQKRALLTKRSDSGEWRKGRSSGMVPADEDKLHPFWRPASPHQTDDGDDNSGNKNEETYRYPLIDNRPRGPRRSLSSRMKRTFAILPIDRQDSYFPATSDDGPERCTVRRTPSGNLRVVKHHGSAESLGGYTSSRIYRPYTASERPNNRKLWFWKFALLKRINADRMYNRNHADDDDTQCHQYDATAVAEGEKKAAMTMPDFGLVEKMGEYGPHTIPRRLSERQREKRSNRLRQEISRPLEVRDSDGEVFTRTKYSPHPMA